MAAAGQTKAAGSPPVLSPYIVVDQFGYRPDSEKIAVIRQPQKGADAPTSFAPGPVYQLVDAASGQVVAMHSPTAWRAGQTDPISGDKVWWFDFTQVKTPGTYQVVDVANNLRSPPFAIQPQVYRKVLVQALRTFFYQRSGFAKDEAHAGRGWADQASHLGPLQDKNCRRFNAKRDAATERDLHGGWYDAGDLNKYTSWTASYIIDLLKAYEAAPHAFGDDSNIPESGNGQPDILDEVQWGLDWLLRMQSSDGSVLSIVASAGASPPSSATKQSLYGDASTSATQSTAAAFAYAARIFQREPRPAAKAYAKNLLVHAEQAYAWADAHPNVLFKNNEASNGSLGLGGGQQETDDYGRMNLKLASSCYLLEITGEQRYKTYFEANYKKSHIMAEYVSVFDATNQEVLLHCAELPQIALPIRVEIKELFGRAMKTDLQVGALRAKVDPYLAYIPQYLWGSNAAKAAQGQMFLSVSDHGLESAGATEMHRAAEHYLHYLHGVNPFGLVYLSNMNEFGATRSVRSFFHMWFTASSPLWSRVGESTYGPAPGFLTGGPNASYRLDPCCPSHCGNFIRRVSCDFEGVPPPLNQPPAKSYQDFNIGWPLNSWEVTENSDGYQATYIKLLARYVD